MEHLSYPNESGEYRAARNALLDAEMELRRQLERVAALRRALPAGGVLKKDYVFERIGKNGTVEQVKLSELFEDKQSLILYALDGAARHVPQRAPFYIVAKSPIARLAAWARDRGWNHLRFLSTAGNSYDADYFGDTSSFGPAMRAERGYEDGKNWDEPMLNVFHKEGGAIRHFWGSELVFAPEEEGQDHRALDLLDPVWGLLDTTPEGRGDFFPKLSYAEVG